jgi:hypothetical protein
VLVRRWVEYGLLRSLSIPMTRALSVATGKIKPCGMRWQITGPDGETGRVGYAVDAGGALPAAITATVNFDTCQCGRAPRRFRGRPLKLR